MVFLKKLWRGWIKFGLALGNFISNVVLTIFYFVVFPFFAAPYRAFGEDPLKARTASSNWILKAKNLEDISDFKNESIDS